MRSHDVTTLGRITGSRTDSLSGNNLLSFSRLPRVKRADMGCPPQAAQHKENQHIEKYILNKIVNFKKTIRHQILHPKVEQYCEICQERLQF
jgi:hypothetical protein